jgi:hypothetical protein
MTFGAKQLRTECYLRQLRIVKKGADSNDHKIGYVALLVQQKRAFAEMQALGVDDGPAKALAAAGAKRRTRHCMIWLLNVMFSEQFAQRVHQIDCRPTRAELDTRQNQGSSAFWTDFHDTYTTSRMDLGELVSDVPVFAKCDPGIIVPHEAAKLRDMWKDVSGRYTLALSNSRVSGMHDNDFFSFCSGKIDVLYMHEWLLIRPGLLALVEGRLPKRARLNTMVDESDSDDEEHQPPQETADSEELEQRQAGRDCRYSRHYQGQQRLSRGARAGLSFCTVGVDVERPHGAARADRNRIPRSLHGRRSERSRRGHCPRSSQEESHAEELERVCVVNEDIVHL